MPHLSSGEVADIPIVIDGIAHPITAVAKRSMAEVAHRSAPHTMAIHKKFVATRLQQMAMGLLELGSVFKPGADMTRTVIFVA